MVFELTPEQKRACDAIGRAIKKAEKMGIFFHNCYGHLMAYPSGMVEYVPDTENGPDCQIGYNCAKLPIEWSDDGHQCRLTEQGKKYIENKESE